MIITKKLNPGENLNSGTLRNNLISDTDRQWQTVGNVKTQEVKLKPNLSLYSEGRNPRIVPDYLTDHSKSDQIHVSFKSVTN